MNSLKPPNLDDRRFADLVEEARQLIRRRCPEWNDLSPSDPGMVLVEVFAHLTETMLYRLNRLPEKAYIEFLRLMGVKLRPPSAASTRLQFSLNRPATQAIDIPRGTRVTTARVGGGEEPPIFSTAETVTIPAGQQEVTVVAYHCDWIEAELAGQSTGLPGFFVRAGHAPIIAPTGDALDLVVAVECEAEEAAGSVAMLTHQGKAYRIWREADSFSGLGEQRHVYVVDRMQGTIYFAPAVEGDGSAGAIPEALAELPPEGREIRLWYRCGGGAAGNVAANVLTVLKDPITGVTVTNPQPALGGRAAETLDNALLRGPRDLHALQRCVTARDFELAVLESGAINRAKAFTRSQLWAHAEPGTVEVILVPNADVPDGYFAPDVLRQHQSEDQLAAIGNLLDERRPMGTNCIVNWARLKTVRVRARIIVHREENPNAVKHRLEQRLYQHINPLADQPERTGWPFGQSIKVWDVYRLIGSEPGVRTVDQVSFIVDDVPDAQVTGLAVDRFQPNTWYAAAGGKVFRSMNGGDGWELVGEFGGERIAILKSFPREISSDRRFAGLLLAVGRCGETDSQLHFSHDCGETWNEGPKTKFVVEDASWMVHDRLPVVLLATENGLYRYIMREGEVPTPVLVDENQPGLGFYAVAVSTSPGGHLYVALAARNNQGVFLSSEGGRPKSFRPVGLEGELVRVLEVQHRGPHRYLWAGLAAVGNEPGKGCFRMTLTASLDHPEGWRPFSNGWRAGGCRALAFHGPTVLAASLRLGVLTLDCDRPDPQWIAPDVNCGLPLRDVGRLQPVDAVAGDDNGPTIMAAGVAGVFRSDNEGVRYQISSARSVSDEVTLPETWLFCSGQHDIRVIGEDEAIPD